MMAQCLQIACNNNLINNNPKFYYAAEPFVNQLKATNDPRSKYLIAIVCEPNNPLGDPNPDLTLANQYGVPVGIPRVNSCDCSLQGN